MAIEIYLGNPPAYITDWIKAHSQPSAAPSPYFTYDSNRVITGLHQGSPNVYKEGTYTDPNDGEEKPYSGWIYGGSDIVENYATAIGNSAFDDGNYNMVSIPPSRGITGNITFQNVTSIEDSAFNYCTNLTNVTIPNVTNIGYSAFMYCSSLTSIIMTNVTSIGTGAFQGCNGLMSVTIGSRIQGIGDSAFSTYGSPITLTIEKTVAEVQAMGTTDYYSTTNVPYSDWGLPSGSTIVCTDGTITIE